ncbi:hypothetical protein EHO59_18075 [Leptospira semungkisensis]|uniref:Uncharacterized protein n=1 Tax=Leptospira semungkisensis TaxID=2484985 RepID=A0A4R9FNA2_9LEPT|nr:hypothetical protein [Leptospira semungkisensis]TGJ99734.1 hypothetical protein EHO59_18075 [Leptospira semungkisensis]
MHKIIFVLVSVLFHWNCFTYSVLIKHDDSLRKQREQLPPLRKTIVELNSIRKSDKEFMISYSAGLYSDKDTKYRYIDEESRCANVDSLRPNHLGYPNLSQLSDCKERKESKLTEEISFEEVPELKNSIWLPEFEIILISSNGLDNYSKLFPNPRRFEKLVFSPKTRGYDTVDFKKHFLGKEIHFAELCKGSYFTHRTLKIGTKTGQALTLIGNGHSYQVLSNHLGKPLEPSQDINSPKNCETLEIRKFSIPKEERIIAIQSELPVEFPGKIRKTENRIFRLKGNLENLPNGILLISYPRDWDKKDDRAFVWSSYPILYPFSVGLDIVTSPLQLISMLIFTPYGHFYVWGCLLAKKCSTPLG